MGNGHGLGDTTANRPLSAVIHMRPLMEYDRQTRQLGGDEHAKGDLSNECATCMSAQRSVRCVLPVYDGRLHGVTCLRLKRKFLETGPSWPGEGMEGKKIRYSHFPV